MMNENTYEEIAYSSYPVKRTDLESMKVVAHLFGVSAPQTKSASVLEVGAGDGGNLIALACAYPTANFVGIDNSASAIARANAQVKVLGLTNIKFELIGIEAYRPSAGSVDYFIAHGIYSWVPDSIKTALLNLARHSLSVNGIGYISYNCYPGWHQRGLLREFMKFHISEIDSPKLQIAQARAAASYLAENATPKDLIYRLFTSGERDTINSLTDWHLFHDHLEVNNDPRYFLDFVKELNQAGLGYLADSELFQMLPLDLPPQEQERLSKVAKDPLRLEQYLDFFRNRMFRRSLIVQGEHPVDREFKRESIASLWLRSKMKKTGDNPMFAHPNGGGITAPTAAIATALTILSEHFPDYIRFSDLIELSGVSNEMVLQQLAGVLLQGVISDLVEARTEVGTSAKIPKGTPDTSALARQQAAKLEPVTTFALDQVQLRKETNLLLTLLDGTKNVAMLASQLATKSAFREGATETEKTALTKVWLKELGELELLR